MVERWHVTFDTMAFLEWKSKPLFFPTSSLFISFKFFVSIILCSLCWAIFLTQNSVLSLVLFARDEEILHLGPLMYRRMNDIIYAVLFNRKLCYFGLHWYSGVCPIPFSWSTVGPAMMSLVCAVACSKAWLSLWMFHICFLYEAQVVLREIKNGVKHS